ncbi:MAG: PH domain-containing protein [Candidatus Thermoplasmatota archaeon]|nr:PH domain-containing protein [Candidatus Thermoplasmatota archaeon]
MDQEEPLKNEQIERVLSPHPLSFMKLQFLCIFLIVWGVLVLWLVNFSEYADVFENWYMVVVVWGLVLLLVGVIASLTTIRWSIFFLYLGIIAGGIGIMASFNWLETASLFIPVWSVCMSILGFLLVEWYRRSHKYIISNLRIVFSGGIITKRERTLRYDKISDINSEQGILGQIFGFGTIIPISQSGFGLGSDQSFAAGGVKIGEKKVGFFGLFGGGREVQTPRARSYYELHGVHPYKEIKKLVESAVQESVITPYQQEQVALQKEHVDQQKEQIDVQKQMRDLLKKQMGPKDEQEE